MAAAIPPNPAPMIVTPDTARGTVYPTWHDLPHDDLVARPGGLQPARPRAASGPAVGQARPARRGLAGRRRPRGGAGRGARRDRVALDAAPRGLRVGGVGRGV